MLQFVNTTNKEGAINPRLLFSASLLPYLDLNTRCCPFNSPSTCFRSLFLFLPHLLILLPLSVSSHLTSSSLIRLSPFRGRQGIKGLFSLPLPLLPSSSPTYSSSLERSSLLLLPLIVDHHHTQPKNPQNSINNKNISALSQPCRRAKMFRFRTRRWTGRD